MSTPSRDRSNDSDFQSSTPPHQCGFIQSSISNPNPRTNNTANSNHTSHSRKEAHTLRQIQLQLDAIKQHNQILEEQNMILEANQPTRKSSKAPSDLVAFDEEVKIFAKKYGVMYEMFPLNAELLKKALPVSIPPSERAARYANSAAEEDALLSELYSILPQHLHHLVASNHFHKILQQSLEAGQSSEIIKLRRVGSRIFNLDSNYFLTSTKRDTIKELCDLLGTTPGHHSYPLFPPILFPDARPDTTNATVFGNWKPLAQILKAVLMGEASLTSVKKGGPPQNSKLWGVSTITPGALAWSATMAIFLLSPDTTFSQDGQGKNSGIQYKNLFHSFKKILVCCWSTPYLTKTRQHIKGHIFGAAKSPVNSPDSEDLTVQIALVMASLQANDAEDLDLLDSAPEISTVPDTAVQVDPSIPPPSAPFDIASSTPLTPPLVNAPVAPVEDDLHVPVHTEPWAQITEALPVDIGGSTVELVDDLEGNKCRLKKKSKKHASSDQVAARKSNCHKM
ncbi:hypothetical protein F4604DRAFT_1919192 [Suillus subluteus]|nr:hypothetical protein F4604DRAFT_1919192 [Suillus subluteus]